MTQPQQVRIPLHPGYGKFGGRTGTVLGSPRSGPLGKIVTVDMGESRVINVWVDECWQCSWLTGSRWATEIGEDGKAYCLECGPASGQKLRAYTPLSEPAEGQVEPTGGP